MYRVPPEPLAEQATDAILGANPFVGIDMRRLACDGLMAASRLAERPGKVAAEAVRTSRELGAVLVGRSGIAPAPGDRRFADPVWSDNPAYHRLMQAYLAATAAARRLVDEAGLAPAEERRAQFLVTLASDALAPTNALISNPAALKRALDTGGQSLLRGARSLLRDVRENGGMPATVDGGAFEVGRNLAVSSGAVVHRDDVFELIQYAPVTETVFERPLVVLPPQINKFYVLDLAPGRSFTEHTVAGGVPYFAISWRNPGAPQREWGLDTYVRAGLQAVEVACQITGSDSANVMGLCAGGVTLSLLLGHLAAIGKLDRVASATLAVAMLDTSSPSPMGMFASDAVVAAALRRSRQRGFLDGAEMSRVFAWMRPNDLVWNYWVNNYLLGLDPPAFDILFWNADNTRLPARLHADFLDLYLRNPLPEGGAIEVLGTPVDLRQVGCPTYVVAGMTDHIVPWRAAHRTSRLFSRASEFVLSSSGHIQSIVNPAGNPKAAYFASGVSDDDPDAWLGAATQSKGSWWEHWLRWLGERSGGRRPAPAGLGSREHRSRGPAPGRYVHER